MGIIAWIIFGALAGWIASLVMGNSEEQGATGNIVVGILGAIIGGFLAQNLGATGVNGFNFYSLFVAILGAVLLLVTLRMIRGRGHQV